MDHHTDVQRSHEAGRYERVWLSVGDFDDISGGVFEPISLHMHEEDYDFLKRWAVYQNTLNKLTLGTKKARSVSRKSLAESMLHHRIMESKAKLREMFEAIGEFPPVSSGKVTKEEQRAMVVYVKRMLTW